MIGNWLLVALGVLALGLGVVGVVVPLLPTTPFLLLAAACFVRSSDRLYKWLTNSPLLGGFIKNYREQRGISLRDKIAALILLWGMIGYTVAVTDTSVWLRLLLIAVAAGVTFHLARVKTLTKQPS